MRTADELRRELDRGPNLTVVRPRPAPAPEPPPPPPEPEAPPPHWPAGELEPGEASARLEHLIEEAVALAAGEPSSAARVTGIKAAAGLGKSEGVLRALAARPPGSVMVHYYAPEARIMGELEGRAGAMGLRARTVRGRTAVVDGEPLCAKAGTAAAVAAAGLPVTTTLCRAPRADGTVELCERYHACRYIGQFRPDGAAVVFMPHEYAALGGKMPSVPGELGLPRPHLVVMDEHFPTRMVRHEHFPLAMLTTPRVGAGIDRDHELWALGRVVAEALEAGGDPGAAGTPDDFRRAAALETAPPPDLAVSPGMRAAEQRRRALRLAESGRGRLARFWRLLADEVERGGPLRRVEVRAEEGGPRVHLWTRADLDLPRVPTLVLDASLDPVLTRPFFPDMSFHVLPVRRNVRVVQVTDTACSRLKLLGVEGDEGQERRAGNRRAEVLRLAEVEARHGPVVVATYKQAAEAMREPGLPRGVDVVHFGRLRGVDAYKGHRAAIVAGREQMPPGEAEGIARALFGDDRVPLELPGEYRREVRGYRMRDGTRAGAPVWAHPDPRVQAVVEHARERECEQAVDRLRLVHRDEPALVLVLTDTPLDLTVDGLTTWRDAMPSRLEVAFARLGGVLPLSPGWLAERFPDLWGTAKAALRDVQRDVQPADQTTQTLIRDFFLGFGQLNAATYRPAGQRGRPSRALIDHAVPDPAAALSALVGPLAAFALDPVPDPPPPPPRMFRWAGEPPPGEAPGDAPPCLDVLELVEGPDGRELRPFGGGDPLPWSATARAERLDPVVVGGSLFGLNHELDEQRALLLRLEGWGEFLLAVWCNSRTGTHHVAVHPDAAAIVPYIAPEVEAWADERGCRAVVEVERREVAAFGGPGPLHSFAAEVVEA